MVIRRAEVTSLYCIWRRAMAATNAVTTAILENSSDDLPRLVIPGREIVKPMIDTPRICKGTYRPRKSRRTTLRWYKVVLIIEVRYVSGRRRLTTSCGVFITRSAIQSVLGRGAGGRAQLCQISSHPKWIF